jgi:DNA-directed RNA polymerase alpha subunit
MSGAAGAGVGAEACGGGVGGMAGNPHDIPLGDLQLAVRSRAVLESAGCATLADILLRGRRQMAAERGCGPAVLKNIEQVAADYGYGF